MGLCSRKRRINKRRSEKKMEKFTGPICQGTKKIPKLKSSVPAPDYPGKWQWALLFLKDTLTPRDTESNVPKIDPLENVIHDAPIVSEECELIIEIVIYRVMKTTII